MKKAFVLIPLFTLIFGCSDKVLQNRKFFVFGKYINEVDSLSKYNYIISSKREDGHFYRYLFTLKSSEEFNPGDTLFIINKHMLERAGSVQMGPMPAGKK